MRYKTYKFLTTYKTYLAFLLGFLPTLFVYGYYYFKKQPPLASLVSGETESSIYAQLTGFPQGEISEIKPPEIVLEAENELEDEDWGEEEVPGARLRVLSGMAIPIMEQETQEATDSGKKLAGVRVIGEMKNVGEEKISGAKSVLRFYDDEENLLATKIGNWTKGYEFLELEAGELNVYDILVPNPPESETVSIQMKPTTSGESNRADRSALKIKNKDLEETSLTTEDEVELIYYKFNGVLVNTGEDEVANPRVYVWLKDDENKVIATAYKVFEADLMTPGQELEAKLLLVPLGDKGVFGYEAKVFGEKL